MTKVELHPEADKELAEAKRWYRKRSQLAARAFAAAITNAIHDIAGAPNRWPETRSGERRLVLSNFPFSILYRVRENGIFITAVAHQKRRPGYWRNRVI